MQRGLSKKLMAGVPRINTDLSISVLDGTGSLVHLIPAEALASGGVGYLYERLVGLDYERRGYNVEYRSHLGYRDAGVDLIAVDSEEKRFVQCKFTLHSMGRGKIEELLYKASKFVKANLGHQKNHFDLVVPDEAAAFPHPGHRNLAKNIAKRVYLRYNETQNDIQLHIVEIPMPLPDSIKL